MSDWKPLLLWLQEYHLSLSHADSTELWSLLPKGTEVYLISSQWIQQVYKLLSSLSTLEEVDAVLRDLRIDNSDIVDDQGALKAGLQVSRDYVVIPESVYRHTFVPLVSRSQDIPSGYIVWDGMMRPALSLHPLTLPCVLIHRDQKVLFDLQLEGNISVETLKERLAGTRLFKIDEGLEIVLWNVRHPYSPEEVLSALGTVTDLAEVMWISPLIEGNDFKLFESMTSKVLLVEITPKKSMFSSWFSSSPKIPIMGLKNIDKNCYLNSLLQSLAHVYPFLIHYSGKPINTMEKPVITEMKAVISALYEKHDSAYLPQEMCTVLEERNKGFQEGEQADVHECFQYLLEMLDSPASQSPIPLLPVFSTEALTPEREWLRYLQSSSLLFGELFGGVQRSVVTCQQCNSFRTEYKPFTAMSLYLPSARTVNITLVPPDLKLPVKQFPVQSNTPLETNETIRTISIQVAEMLKTEDFIVGEVKNRLFRGPLGMSNIIEQSDYIVLEVPRDEFEKCTVLVDIYNSNGRELQPVASRVFHLPLSIPIDSVIQHILQPLVELEMIQTDLQRKLTTILFTLKTPQEKFEAYTATGQLELLSLDCSDVAVSPMRMTDCGQVNSIGDLCKIRRGKIPRLRLTLRSMDSDLISALQYSSSSSFTLTGLFRRSVDSGTVLTLLQMVEYSLSEKPLNEEDRIRCENCREHCKHLVRTEIIRWPLVLVFALQRVRIEDGRLKKTTVSIQYPPRGLDLSQYEKGARTEAAALYDLKAVVHHAGKLDGGHYTTNAQDPASNLWCYFDDETAVVKDDMAALDEHSAYLLFYLRRSSLAS